MPTANPPTPSSGADLAARLRAILAEHGLAHHPAAAAILDAVEAPSPPVRTRWLDRLPLEYEAVSLMDADGITLEANVGAEAVLGRSPAELRGLAATAHVHPDDVAHCQAALKELVAQPDQTRRVCVRIRHRDGTWRWIECQGRNWLHRPDIGAIVVEYRDVTTQRQAEMELRASEQFHRAVFAGHPIPMLILDADTDRVLAANDAATRLYGFAPIEFQGCTLADLGITAEPRVGRGIVRHRGKHGQTLVVEVAEVHVIFGDRPARCLVIHDITERIRAEAELRFASQKLELHIENTPLAVIEWDPEFRISRWSRRAEAIFGWSAKEVEGRRPSEFGLVIPEEAAFFHDTLNRLWRGPESQAQLLSHHRRKDGDTRVCEWFNSVLRDDNGHVTSILSLVLDVTERHAAEMAVAARENRLHTFLEHIPAMAFIKDATGRYVYGNSAWSAQFGARTSDLLGSTDYDLWPRSTADLFRASDRKTLERNAPEHFVERALARDGTERWFKVNKFPLLENGKPPMVGAIVFDVSREYQTVEAQRMSTETLQVIIEASPLAIIMLDANFRVQLWNPAAERLFGWSAAEVLGQPYPAVSDDQLESYRAILGRLLAGESIHGVEQVRQHKSGAEILILQSSAPLRDATGRVTGIVALISDITEKRRLEKERLAFEARLQQAQKLESLGVLAGGIAHDFNNMITGMVGFIELAQQSTQPSRAADYLEKARAVAQRTAEITQQLLAYAGKGKFAVRPIDLNAIVLDARDLLEISVQRKAGPVRLALAPDLPLIDADAAQITQVLLNLVLNAADASSTDGEIVVATGVAECTAEDLTRGYHDGSCQPGTYVFLEVSDHGTGIPPEILAHLFEPFYTTKFLGRGLGLPAVFGIVRGHHGLIRVASSPQGTTMRVLFPRSTTAPLPPAAPLELLGSPKGTVLVIDDEPAVRELVVRVLMDEGYQVLDAGNGPKGLEIFAAHAETISAVILDFSMPGMTGDAVFAAIRQRSEVPVILISGFGTADTAARFHQARRLTYLAKPFRVRELLRAFHQVLANAMPSSPC